jgi:hypothetical protein
MKEFRKTDWPGVTDSNDFDPESELPISRHDIVKTAKSVGFEDADETNLDAATVPLIRARY